MVTLCPPEFAVFFTSPDSNWLSFFHASLLVPPPNPYSQGSMSEKF